MPKRQDKKALRVRDIFDNVNTGNRQQWEFVNQKGFDFANDNQLSADDKELLEEQGMPTFTINRIIPVVEMLNFYATANQPRWQAIGTEGSDSDVAAVFSDMADYVWYHSNGQSLLSNAVNDSVAKSIGYLLIDINPNADQGMGEVVIKQPDPFDVYVDPKSRSLLFEDAAYILIRKVLPRTHLMKEYPDSKRKIKNANSNDNSSYNYTEKVFDETQKDFSAKDILDESTSDIFDEEDTGKQDLIEYYELFEKEQQLFVNMFYKVPLDPSTLAQIKEQVSQKLQDMQNEQSVSYKEKELELAQAAKAGQILPERMQLELEKLQKQMSEQLKVAELQFTNELQKQSSVIENKVISKEEYNIVVKDKDFSSLIVDSIEFYDSRIKKTCVVGDVCIYEKYLPTKIKDYPLIPFHYKWTGTPYPISAVSPLIGKQQELNKVHQLMVHNASLGSSLRWMYEEGSIDTEHWEKYAAAPGALLPLRSGFNAPTPVMPFQLPNAFFGISGEGKQDMEYLAGIYSSMQGDTNQTKDMPFKGMLAIDEYGTRRVKYWLKHSIEPALKQVGELVRQYTQSIYTANKIFRIVQPNAITEEKQVEINIPIYNDMGEAIGKYMDYASSRFDIRLIAGSTLPVNRWAYLAELKELLRMGVVDDVAVLSETDIKNKDKIVKRKSLYSQLSKQIESMEKQMQDKEGTIETLERQLVQAGIKSKVMQGEMEVTRKVAETKANVEKEYSETKHLQNQIRNEGRQYMENEKGKLNELLNSLPLKDKNK
jgi:hypothetical protein|tara:strand:+ start:4493 stop:6796 length:2304 start_codon:yes stop_codon:yes gene_type:complete